jgi:hypothetical protein
MNRWLDRLAELEGERKTHSLAFQNDVRNIQNAQNRHQSACSEHSEQFEQQVDTHTSGIHAGLPGCAERNVKGECAAIISQQGGSSGTWDEGFARLNPDRPPNGVPITRWQQFIEDAVTFLHSPFCCAAAALGWSAHDLFGCDAKRPFERIDQAGLLWLLNGKRLIALTSNEAILDCQNGVRQTYRRTPTEAGRVLAWELPSRCETVIRA